MNAQYEELNSAEQVIEKMARLQSAERIKIRKERARRNRKRLDVLLQIERLEQQRCEDCREVEGFQQNKDYFNCACDAAVEIRRLGKRLEELTSPINVEEKRENHRFTPEVVKMAEENGITYSTLWRRVTQYGWTPEKAAKEPVVRARNAVIWTDEMTEITKREFKNGKTAREVWRKHFSRTMAHRTFMNKTLDLRRELAGNPNPRSLATTEEMETIRKMVASGRPRKEIRAKFRHVNPSTLDSRIAKVRKELKEEGKL